MSYVEQIAQALRTLPALGRISVTADPVVLATKPELDVLMETGDTIYVPKRPSSVTVAGEVLSTGAFAYKAGLTVKDYIRLAGGEGGAADDSLVFVVLPDGTSRPEGDSWWSFRWRPRGSAGLHDGRSARSAAVQLDGICAQYVDDFQSACHDCGFSGGHQQPSSNHYVIGKIEGLPTGGGCHWA